MKNNNNTKLLYVTVKIEEENILQDICYILLYMNLDSLLLCIILCIWNVCCCCYFSFCGQCCFCCPFVELTMAFLLQSFADLLGFNRTLYIIYIILVIDQHISAQQNMHGDRHSLWITVRFEYFYIEFLDQFCLCLKFLSPIRH